MRTNPRDVGKYTKALSCAIERRGGKSYCVHSFNESHYAELVIHHLGNVRCSGAQWHAFESGRWQNRPRDIYRKLVRECIHPEQRQHKRISDVVGSVESALQVVETQFCGAYKLTAAGSVLLNAANGVIELTDAEEVILRSHDPEHGFSLQMPTAYDPAARCPLFDSVLSEALPCSADAQLLQCFAGSILFPRSDYEATLVSLGKGNTGKSTLGGGIRDTLGKDLCGSLDIDALCAPTSYSLAGLKHKWLNLGSELKATEVGEASMLKTIVSGETFQAREIYGRPAPVTSTVKLWFLSNHMPRFRNGTDAELRRMRLLHFNNPPAVIDRALKAKLRAETSGILNWMIHGYFKLRGHDEMPRGGEDSRKLLNVFAASNDPVGRFLAECCQLHPGGEVSKQVLFDAFVEWCNCNGIVTSDDSSYFFRMLRSSQPLLRYVRRRLGGRRHSDDPEKCRMVVGIRIPKNPGPLMPESVADAARMKASLLGIRAVPIEPLDIRDT